MKVEVIPNSHKSQRGQNLPHLDAIKAVVNVQEPPKQLDFMNWFGFRETIKQSQFLLE